MRAVIVLVCLAVGCGKKDESRRDQLPEPPPQAGLEQGASPVPEAFAPPLTAGRLRAAKAGVRPFQEWLEAWAHLLATAGNPTRTGPSLVEWTVIEDGRCHLLEVQRDPERDQVAAVSYTALEPGAEGHDRCTAGANSQSGSASGSRSESEANQP
jgi:hypothetical protein